MSCSLSTSFLGGRNVTYDHARKCPVHFEVQAENKGLEGMLLHYNRAKGIKVLFGLCEGTRFEMLRLNCSHHRLVVGRVRIEV